MSQQIEVAEQDSAIVSQKSSLDYSAISITLALAVLSAILYSLLYLYGDDIRDLALATNAGDKTYFYVPIVIALGFSFVHGAFTGHFWDVLGLKAKK